ADDRSFVLSCCRYVPARLENYARIWPKDKRFPFIVPMEGHSVDGVVYLDVPDYKLKEIDLIEDVRGGLYERIRVTVIVKKKNEERVEADTYVGKSIADKWLKNRSIDEEIPEILEGEK
ncbi:MAG: gamma-glutamylcyclotransferase family protein, partial [Candidatus Korarchaeota archaeon]